MEQLYEILEELRPDVDFKEETQLIDGGVLDSFDIIQLVAILGDEFDVEINPGELVPQNFNSADAMWSLITRLQED